MISITMEEVTPEMILNWDQSGIKLVPSSNWTLEKQGSKRVELTGVNDKDKLLQCFVVQWLETFLLHN